MSVLCLSATVAKAYREDGIMIKIREKNYECISDPNGTCLFTTDPTLPTLQPGAEIIVNYPDKGPKKGTVKLSSPENVVVEMPDEKIGNSDGLNIIELN